jgi:steroid 5-alpha reductase family enzyme
LPGTKVEAVALVGEETAVSGFPLGHFATGLVVTAVAVVVMMLVTWMIALKVGRFDVVDVAWGLGSCLSRS